MGSGTTGRLVHGEPVCKSTLQYYLGAHSSTDLGISEVDRPSTNRSNSTGLMYIPPNQRSWWLNIVKINGKHGPGYMGGKASSAKEIAHKLCYIIH